MFFKKKKVQQDTSSFLKRKHGLMKEISGNHMAADVFLARLSLQTSWVIFFDIVSMWFWENDMIMKKKKNGLEEDERNNSTQSNYTHVRENEKAFQFLT